MSYKYLFALAAWIAVPIAAIAQQTQPQHSPTDSTALVPAASYESAFKNYRAASEDNKTPDKVWRAANDEMGSLGGHAGHINAAPTGKSDANAKPEQSDAVHHGKHH